MAPNPKVIAAYRAMSSLGIHESKVKPVLKKLLRLYEKKWELIEEENYRALADAIFEEDENEALEPDQKGKKEGEVDDEAPMHDEPLRPLKRLRLRGQEVQSSRLLTSSGPNSAAFPLKMPKLEPGTIPGSSSRLQPQSATVLSEGNARIGAYQVQPRDTTVDKGKQPLSPQDTPRGSGCMSDKTPAAVPFKEPTVEPGASPLSKNKMPHPYTLIIPKDEPIDFEVPLAMIHPETSSGRDSSMKNDTAGKQDGHNTVASQCRNENVEGGDNTVASQCRNENVEGGGILPSSKDGGTSNAELDSLSTGEEGSVKITPAADVPKESEENGTLIVNGNKDSVTFSCTANGSISVKSSPALAAAPVSISLPCPSSLDDAVLVSKKDTMNDFLESDGGMEVGDPISPNSCNAVNAPKYQPTADNTRAVAPKYQLTADNTRDVYDMNDLTKGEEKVKISWVNNTTDDIPPSFHYIPRNLVFRDAYVNISLSRIGNEDCCSTCMGNCVLSSKPCFCANKTGGDFAYSAQGLLKEEFLEECIAISRDPQNNFYCKECPLESSKNDDCLEPCKGHLKRKFIKECWSKCSCGKHCGNRIVQRGITRNLQVFLTSDGKGWGLRTIEDLPKGAFVCEFVGEILTVKELHERNLKYSKNGKYRYPVLLDAEWDSGVVKDNRALCLFAASYGNAARFINHRCLDANLIEIPVEVEGPSHHYYHFAFFTSRAIAAQEELTWDYGINFDDHDQSVELFRCRCGSKFCRDMKRSSRITRSIAG